VKHRNIDYDVEEVALAQWRWKLYPKEEVAGRVTSGATFESRDAAVEACIIEINKCVEQTNKSGKAISS